jgi:hypothetical protein
MSPFYVTYMTCSKKVELRIHGLILAVCRLFVSSTLAVGFKWAPLCVPYPHFDTKTGFLSEISLCFLAAAGTFRDSASNQATYFQMQQSLLILSFGDA